MRRTDVVSLRALCELGDLGALIGDDSLCLRTKGSPTFYTMTPSDVCKFMQQQEDLSVCLARAN